MLKRLPFFIKLLLASAFIFGAQHAFAQKLRYVTFFPAPFVNHSEIYVKNIAVLGAANPAEIAFSGNINLGPATEEDNAVLLRGLSMQATKPTGQIFAFQQAQVGEMDENYAFSYPVFSYFATYSPILFNSESSFTSTEYLNVVDNLTVKKLKFSTLGEINATGCARLCWSYLKLPKEDYFHAFLVCKETEGDCPSEGGYASTPSITRVYAVISGGMGYRVIGSFDGTQTTLFTSSSPAYQSTATTIKYYTTLPTAVTASGSISISAGIYTGIGTFNYPTNVYTGTLSGATEYTDTITEDCPSGLSAEMICQSAASSSYRCIRNRVTSSTHSSQYTAAGTAQSQAVLVTPRGPTTSKGCCPSTPSANCIATGTANQQAMLLACTLINGTTCTTGCNGAYTVLAWYYQPQIIDYNTEIVSCQ